MTPADKSKLVSRTFLLLLAILLGWGVYLIMQPFIEVLIAAAVVTISFYPAYLAVERRIGNRNLAALVTVVILLLVILLPVTYLGTTIAGELRDAYAALQKDSAEEGGWSTWLSHVIDRPVQWVAGKTGMSAPGIRALLLQNAERLSAAALKWLSGLLANFTSTLGNLLFVLFVAFFLFQSGHRFRAIAAEYLPLEEHRLDRLLEVMQNAIVANIYGMLAVGAAQGLFVGIGFAFAGLRSPVLWGMVASFASLIPIVGTALIWVPGVLILLATGAWGKAIFLAVWGVVVVGLSDNFIRPLVIGRGVELSTLTIFLALMGGVQVFGFIGLFAGPVIFTLAYVVVRMLHEERLEWEGRALTILDGSPTEDSTDSPAPQ